MQAKIYLALAGRLVTILTPRTPPPTVFNNIPRIPKFYIFFWTRWCRTSMTPFSWKTVQVLFFSYRERVFRRFHITWTRWCRTSYKNFVRGSLLVKIGLREVIGSIPDELRKKIFLRPCTVPLHLFPHVQAMCTRLGYVHLLFNIFSVQRICKGLRAYVHSLFYPISVQQIRVAWKY